MSKATDLGERTVLPTAGGFRVTFSNFAGIQGIGVSEEDATRDAIAQVVKSMDPEAEIEEIAPVGQACCKDSKLSMHGSYVIQNCPDHGFHALAVFVPEFIGSGKTQAEALRDCDQKIMAHGLELIAEMRRDGEPPEAIAAAEAVLKLHELSMTKHLPQANPELN